MIRNFTDRDTELLFRNERNRRYNAIANFTLLTDHLALLRRRLHWTDDGPADVAICDYH